MNVRGNAFWKSSHHVGKLGKKLCRGDAWNLSWALEGGLGWKQKTWRALWSLIYEVQIQWNELLLRAVTVIPPRGAPAQAAIKQCLSAVWRTTVLECVHDALKQTISAYLLCTEPAIAHCPLHCPRFPFPPQGPRNLPQQTEKSSYCSVTVILRQNGISGPWSYIQSQALLHYRR